MWARYTLNRTQGWLAAGVLVAAWGVLRLAVFQSVILPLTYVLPLLVCVFTGSRAMLWTMAGIFLVMHSVNQFVVLEENALSDRAAAATFVVTVLNILVAGVVIQMIIALRNRLEVATGVAEENRYRAEAYAEQVRGQAAELAVQNEELSQQSEELSQQTEELSRQTEDLNCHREELAAQNAELRTQAEEIERLSAELGSRERLLEALLDLARVSGSERAVAERLCASTIELLGQPASVALVLERQEEGFVPLGFAGVPHPASLPAAVPAAHSFAQVVMTENRTASLNDAELRPDLGLASVVGSPPFRSALASPIHVDGVCIGVLEVYGRSAHEWSVQQFRLVRWLALQASQIFETLRLHTSMRRQAALIDLSPSPTIVRTLDGRVSFWSRAAESLYGWAKSEARERAADVLLQTRSERPLAEIEREVIETGHWYGELTRMTRDGREVVVESRWLARRDPGGQTVEILESNADITARKQVERALLEADRHKNEFLATLSHELRNPLAPIRYALDLMSREAAQRADGSGPSPTLVIERQLTHLVRLVDDLLDVSRIASNKIRLQTKRVRIDGIVHQAVEATLPEIDRAGHHLTVSLPTDEVWLLCDAQRIAQVLINLLNNAARYTPNGGRIELKVEAGPEDLTLTVTDTGVGLDAQDIDRVFDMFSQVGDAGQDGLGIGLALAKGVVALHGGSIEARSDGAGRGCQFVVRLARIQPEASAAASREDQKKEESRGVAAEGPRRILVVDDNVDSAEMMKAFLEIDGHQVLLAHDGVAAIQAVRDFLPHVALLDIGLPGMDGYEVARSLRADPLTRETHLIAVTGWGQEADRERARQNGFDAHLTKPADPERIRRLVSSAGKPDAKPATAGGG